MKKILVLLVAVCSLFVACSKDEGGSSHSLDGTKWYCKIEPRFSKYYFTYNFVFDDGYVSIYTGSKNPTLKTTTTYKVIGDTIIFGYGDFLRMGGDTDSDYCTVYLTEKATLSSDKSSFDIELMYTLWHSEDTPVSLRKFYMLYYEYYGVEVDDEFFKSIPEKEYCTFTRVVE